ncbi:YIP1 family protein [Natronoarchaeum mannanilyticum]|uniref:YIP1 family protein n=2 Tax=Natronoarchaeum mannanilyticum TaxID=926360 RepID=A0AAV3T5F6_9EURY
MVTEPDAFIDQYDEDHGIGYPIKFVALSVIAMALPITLLMVLANLSSPADLRAAAIIGAAIVLIGFVASIIEMLLVHGVVYALGGREGSVSTFEAYAFPSAVRLGLAWIPLVNLAVGFYGLYLQIKTLASFQGVSSGRSAVALVFASLLVLPTMVIAIAVIAAFFLELGGGGGAPV